MAYSIALVDDHDLVRGGLKPLIEEDGTCLVTGEYSNGRELLDGLIRMPARPDVVILDLDMPVMNGRETLQRLQEFPDAPPVLVLTISGDDTTVLDMVRTGARGFLPKYCTRVELRKALHDIIRTGYYHSELEVKVLHQSFRNGVRHQAPFPDPGEQLTARELRFIELVCDQRELSYKLIADEMNVSFRTVDGYREAVFMKLNIKTKIGLVFYALQRGIVRYEDVAARKRGL